MVIYKLHKTGQMALYSHHDFMRMFELCLNRAGVKVNKSRTGKEKIYYSPATSIGVESKAEFIEIDIDITAHKLAEIVKTYLPEGLTIASEYDVKNKLNISKIACLAKYEVTLPKIEGIQKKITELITDENFTVKLKMNNEIRENTVKDGVHNFYFENGKFYLISKIGNENLNISVLMQQIFHKLKISEFYTKVVKTNIFAKVENRFHDVELIVLRSSN